MCFPSSRLLHALTWGRLCCCFVLVCVTLFYWYFSVPLQFLVMRHLMEDVASSGSAAGRGYARAVRVGAPNAPSAKKVIWVRLFLKFCLENYSEVIPCVICYWKENMHVVPLRIDEMKSTTVLIDVKKLKRMCKILTKSLAPSSVAKHFFWKFNFCSDIFIRLSHDIFSVSKKKKNISNAPLLSYRTSIRV